MRIWRADEQDLASVAQIANVSWRMTYRDLLDADTIERWLAAAYSPSALEQRWEDHPIFLIEIDGRPAAFTDVYVEGSTIVVAAMCTHPEYRRHGAATALLEKIRSLAPSFPVTVDLILGNQSGEGFVEHLGFSPGETMEVHLYGEPFLERRWWMESALMRSS
ncbi:MAG: GNAT family N-acetyltransferase [Gammaproteobacteria bacterium]|nr:GNAT family N-acetyltransferase [Gammaproteobacteria bacterium]